MENQSNQILPSSNEKTSKKYLVMGSFMALGLLLLGAGVLYIYKSQSSNEPINEANTGLNMDKSSAGDTNAVDPQVQAIVDSYLDLSAKLSDRAKHGKPTSEDEKVIDQMMAISAELRKYDSNKIDAMLGVDAYGYDISILINGKDTGVSGDKNTILRLFNADSVMALISTQDVRDHNFLLKKGENTISIAFKKKKDSSFGLEVNLVAYGSDKVLTFATNKEEGTIEKTFVLELAKPADFQTIEIKE